MDNRLKRDLVKFFKKMNKNNMTLFKEDKSKLKDIENIEDDEKLIEEGLQQCQFVLNHFSEKIEKNIKEEKERKEKEENERKEKERKEREEREKKEKERREKEERERREKEKKEKERKDKEEKEREEKEKKDKEEREKKEKEKEIKEKQKERKKPDDIKQKELKEKKLKKEQKKEENSQEQKNIKNENKKLTGLEEIKEETKKKVKIQPEAKDCNKNIPKTQLEKKSSNKLPILKRAPTLSELTDEQKGQTEKALFDLGDGIKITVEWKYLHDKTYIPKEDDEDPEKSEKVDMIFTTNYIDPLILHWGVFRAFHESEWIHPDKECYPEYSKEFDKKAIQTEFTEDESEEWPSIRIMLKRGMGFENVIGGINFVIYDPVKNRWYNNYRKDFQIKFKLKINKKKSKMILIDKHLSVPEFVSDVITCESSYGSWTLMHRYNKCCDVINNWDENTPNEYWYWILIWLRYSYQRQLDWQRNYNTRPRELSNSMDRLSMLITGKYSNSVQKEKPYKNLFNSQSSLIKHIMSLLGKGTGNGQAIRDEILVIMHKNKIPESNSNFYEQWHQKLHNNTTPDDIIICEALLAFLYSGNIEDYRNTLKRGGISKERMASYERKITAEPWHNRGYIEDFERYLKILKSVHASTDLIQTYEQCKYIIGNNWKLDDIIKNKDDKDVINQIRRVTEGREELQGIIRNNINDWGKLRDVLFFELSLEIYMRQLVERIIHIQINYQTYIYEISLVLRNIKVSYPNFSEFNICLDDWFNVVEKLKNNNDFSKTGMLKVKSVVSRLNRLLSNVIDFYNQNFEGRAKFFGKECGVDNYYSSMFAEELMRGSIFFALSMLLKKIEPTIRKCAQLGDWLIISRGKNNKVRGMVKHVKNLHDVQFMKYPEKTIILTEAVSGNEEIPINCVCLIIIKTENYPDILAHVSVRARNLDVPFAVCFNEQRANDMLKLINKNGEVNFENQEVIFKESNEIINQDTNKENLENNTEEIKKVQVVKTGDKYKKIYLELDEFEKNVVGAKSNNTQKLFGKVPGCDWLKYPESFAIPFNVHEYFLSLDKNKEIAEEIEEYIQKISNAIKKETISELLLKCRNLTLELNFVENEETLKLKKKLIDFGIKSDDLNLAFKAIKSVWASKFNERAYIATSKVGITLKDIRMAVLCQKIIPAEYAYVIHTKNPSNNNSDEVFAEVCVGMGEALVGAYEGQSLSFAYNKKSKTYDIKSFPNKSIALKNSGFIFRSDSNTEDLEGFSGAGLFDSVPMIEDREEEVCYHKDKIFYDEGFRDYLIKKIGELGIGVENMYGGLAQDIEGVFYNNNFYIVQTRPQV